MDDEAEEANLPLQGSARGGAADEENLEDSSEEESEHESEKAQPSPVQPKTWIIKDEEGKSHTVSIKDIKGKWINMSTGARILGVSGKPAEEVVQDTIAAGDEADLLPP